MIGTITVVNKKTEYNKNRSNTIEQTKEPKTFGREKKATETPLVERKGVSQKTRFKNLTVRWYCGLINSSSRHRS